MSNPFDRPAGPPPDFVEVADRPRPSASETHALSGRTRGRRTAEPSADPRSAAGQDREPDPHEFARNIVLRQLTMAPRSRKQLEDKLREKDCAADVAREVLDRLEEVGLVDDVAYAQMLVRSQQTGRGLAKRALRQELRRKGVDDDTAAATLDDIDDVDERDRARALVDKKLRSMHGLDATVQTRRLAGMLARKGYSTTIAWAVIREAIADAPEHQPD